MSIGSRIKECRKERGLTQKQLAVKLGVATGTIQQYELGKREPRSSKIDAIADILKVDPYELYFDNPYGLVVDEIGQLVSTSDPDDYLDEMLLIAFYELNLDGRQKALERVRELAQIPAYQTYKKPPQATE